MLTERQRVTLAEEQTGLALFMLVLVVAPLALLAVPVLAILAVLPVLAVIAAVFFLTPLELPTLSTR